MNTPTSYNTQKKQREKYEAPTIKLHSVVCENVLALSWGIDGGESDDPTKPYIKVEESTEEHDQQTDFSFSWD